MLVELIQINEGTAAGYQLGKIYVNPKHIIYMSQDFVMTKLLREGKINLDLHDSVSFTRIKLNENSFTSEIVVVGDPPTIKNKIFTNTQRQLLKS